MVQSHQGTAMNKLSLFLTGCATGLLVVAVSSYLSVSRDDESDEDEAEGSWSTAVAQRRRRSPAGEAMSLVAMSGGNPEQLGAGEPNDKDSQALLNLLYTIAEDQARKEGYVHRGVTCNVCEKYPIRGVRYKCANCRDFDVCEMCEAQGGHDPIHVMLKIRIPIPPLANPRDSLLPILYPGGKHSGDTGIPKETIRALQAETHFDQVELEALFEQFKSLSTEDGIDKSTFERCLGPLGVKRNLVTERIFSFFDQDGDGKIIFRELVCGLSVLCKGSQEEKIAYAFKGYDLDNSGYISRDELYRMFKAYFYLSMELVRDVVKALEEEMMANFDDEGGKPVSAVFTAPIPRDSSDGPPSSKEDMETFSEDPFNLYARDAAETSMSGNNSFRRSSSVQHGSSEHIGVTFANPEVTRRESLPYTQSSESNIGSGSINNFTNLHTSIRRRSSAPLGDRSHSTDMLPMMEAMSQEAIEEMVDSAFKAADLDNDGLISFSEFKRWAQTDITMIAWFEALGSVF